MNNGRTIIEAMLGDVTYWSFRMRGKGRQRGQRRTESKSDNEEEFGITFKRNLQDRDSSATVKTRWILQSSEVLIQKIGPWAEAENLAWLQGSKQVFGRVFERKKHFYFMTKLREGDFFLITNKQLAYPIKMPISWPTSSSLEDPPLFSTFMKRRKKPPLIVDFG